MSLRIIVLAKQVPDTRNVGKDAMKADGTINRAALPAIFNPEDLNALEQALRLKTVIKTSSGGILLNVSSMMICFKVVFSQGFDLAILPGQIFWLSSLFTTCPYTINATADTKAIAPK